MNSTTLESIFFVKIYKIIVTSYPPAYLRQIADNNIPTEARKLPTKDVFRIPYLSVSMEATGERIKHAPTAADPTKEASIPDTFGFSSFDCSSNATNTVPNEFIIPNMIPLQRKLDKTTNQACNDQKG